MCNENMIVKNNIIKDFIGQFLLSVAKHGMTLFAGAGISVISPCLCPTWDRLKKTILDEFMSKLIENDWPIKSYLCGARQSILEMEIRPETFMWGCEQILGHNSVIEMIKGLNSSVPNYNHESMALLARDGYVKSIITTNFETYIERSLLSNKVNFTLARDRDEIESLILNPNNGIPLFKPHGCLSKPSSMMYKIDDIQKLTNSYEELMYSLLKCAPVLVVGYSGNDEDIFPVLKRALEESPFPSLICVYPGSTLNEPIVRWNTVTSSKIKHIRIHADVILRSFLAILNKNKKSTSELLKNINTNTKSDFRWQDLVNHAVKRISYDKIAITISRLCSIHGNHQRALSFANLAEDICDNPTLSPNLGESLQIIRNIQSISYAEQDKGDIISTALQNRRVKESLKKNSANEFAMTLIDRAYMALRGNDLENAEKDLVKASKILTSNSTDLSDEINDRNMICLWYFGILYMKQGKLEQAENAFNQAVEMSDMKNDIYHKSKILLDYGQLKVDQGEKVHAIKIWQDTITIAEKANNWETAAKASRQSGKLLISLGENDLGEGELKRSKYYESLRYP